MAEEPGEGAFAGTRRRDDPSSDAPLVKDVVAAVAMAKLEV
jgi:hypothetical protein